MSLIHGKDGSASNLDLTNPVAQDPIGADVQTRKHDWGSGKVVDFASTCAMVTCAGKYFREGR